MNFDLLDTEKETIKIEKISFSCSEVDQLLLSCADNSLIGSDNIPSFALHQCSSYLRPQFMHYSMAFYMESLLGYTFAQIWFNQRHRELQTNNYLTKLSILI